MALDKTIQNIIKYIEEKRFGEAEELVLTLFSGKDESKVLFWKSIIICATGKIIEAIDLLKKAIEIRGDAFYYYKLGTFYDIKRGRIIKHNIHIFYDEDIQNLLSEALDNSIKCFAKAYEIDNDFQEAAAALARSYLRASEVEKAKEYFKKAFDLKSNDEESKFFLEVLSNLNPSIMPISLIEEFFDQVAENYEDYSEEILKYRVPSIVAPIIFKLYKKYFENRDPYILDLGCGAGIFAKELAKKQFNCLLTGVDISFNMLKVTQSKNLYNSLIQANVIDYLKSAEEKFHFIIALDLFIYIGNLDNIIAEIDRILFRDGIFIFTIEHEEQNDFAIDATMRYRHSKQYIGKLLAKNDMQILEEKNMFIRQEKEKKIYGSLYVVKKSQFSLASSILAKLSKLAKMFKLAGI